MLKNKVVRGRHPVSSSDLHVCTHEQAHTLTVYTHAKSKPRRHQRYSMAVECLCNTTELWVGSASLHKSCVLACAHNPSTWEQKPGKFKASLGCARPFPKKAKTTKEASCGASGTLQSWSLLPVCEWAVMLMLTLQTTEERLALLSGYQPAWPHTGNHELGAVPCASFLVVNSVFFSSFSRYLF